MKNIKYRCLFIESGDYLYVRDNGIYLYSIYEIPGRIATIFEGSKYDIIHKLDFGAMAVQNHLGEDIRYTGNEQLFDFVEVLDE